MVGVKEMNSLWICLHADGDIAIELEWMTYISLEGESNHM